MGDLAIRVEGLSKRYYIGAHQQKLSPRRKLLSMVAAPLRRIRQFGRSSHREEDAIWAIKNVSFDVMRGEVMGVIGRNGAGKSTLLKILSRITAPTSGRAELHGRVGSLLEVGTGFHPELTGRENIFLSGTILGMTRSEIRGRFDEIVDFSGVEKFIDTPVKRYSSGMGVRLGFAVAAHLDPEILIVDEVLAVGDVGFRKKCLGKIGSVAKGGRTVLLVSHNIAAITQMCERTILLENGVVKQLGATDDVIGTYLIGTQSHEASIDLTSAVERSGSGEIQFSKAELVNSHGKVCQDYNMGDSITIRMTVDIRQSTPPPKFVLQLRTSDGLLLSTMADHDDGFVLESSSGSATVTATLKDIRLYPGSYYITLMVAHGMTSAIYDAVESALMFNIISGGNVAMRSMPRSSGVIYLSPEWRRG